MEKEYQCLVNFNISSIITKTQNRIIICQFVLSAEWFKSSSMSQWVKGKQDYHLLLSNFWRLMPHLGPFWTWRITKYLLIAESRKQWPHGILVVKYLNVVVLNPKKSETRWCSWCYSYPQTTTSNISIWENDNGIEAFEFSLVLV